jgi:anthranilate phosphoribosyltransferase
MDSALLGKLIGGENLAFGEMQSAMDGIMEGRWTPAQIAGFLIALRIKGETPEEIAAAAHTLRSKAVAVPVSRPNVIDTCGTGGDHSGTFNISTAAAVVAAAAGASVAKHGNRAISSRCGSANVLQELGVNLELTPEQVGACVDRVGVGFLFAPKLNPAMKHVAGPRQELGQRTIFNLMGPLLNPARARRQLIGVFDNKLTRVLAEVLQRLDSEHVLIVSSSDGLDEISLCAPTKVAELKNGVVSEYVLNPQEFGFSLATKEDLLGGDAPQNAAILLEIFGGAKGPKRDIVVLNAAAALYVSGLATSIKEGVAKARQALDSGAAKKTLEIWVEFSQNPITPSPSPTQWERGRG